MVLKMYSGVRIMVVTFIRVMSGYGRGPKPGGERVRAALDGFENIFRG